MSNKGVHGTIRASTHGINMDKLNTFLRLVETVLVTYLKTGHDSINMTPIGAPIYIYVSNGTIWLY